jgi:hypothetical protein
MDKDRLREEICLHIDAGHGPEVFKRQVEAILSLILKQRREAADGVAKRLESCQAALLNETNGSQQDLGKIFDIELSAVRHAAQQEGEVLSTAQANVEMHDRTEV